MTGLDSVTPGAAPFEIFTHFPGYTVKQVEAHLEKLILVNSLLLESLVESGMWLMDLLDSSLESLLVWFFFSVACPCLQVSCPDWYYGGSFLLCIVWALFGFFAALRKEFLLARVISDLF